MQYLPGLSDYTKPLSCSKGIFASNVTPIHRHQYNVTPNLPWLCRRRHQHRNEGKLDLTTSSGSHREQGVLFCLIPWQDLVAIPTVI